MARRNLLTLFLALLPLTLCLYPLHALLPAEAALFATFWGLPIAVGLVGFLAGRPLLRSPPDSPHQGPLRWFRLVVVMGAILVAEWSFLPIGLGIASATTSYGNHRLFDNLFMTSAWALPLCLLAGVIGFEWTLRRVLLASWIQAVGWKGGAVVAGVIGAGMSLPFVTVALSFGQLPVVMAEMARQAFREVTYTLLFAETRSVIPGGIQRGLSLFISGFIISDANLGYYPAAYYVSSSPQFAGAMIGCAVMATGISAGALPWIRETRRQER